MKHYKCILFADDTTVYPSSTTLIGLIEEDLVTIQWDDNQARGSNSTKS